MKKYGVVLLSFLVMSMVVGGTTPPKLDKEYPLYFLQEWVKQETKRIEETLEKLMQEEQEKQEERILTLSVAGDVTLGYYYGQPESNRFDKIAQKEDSSYFFRQVSPIFEEDDLTIVNLEGPLTTGGKRQEKRFAIKGEPTYTNILLEGDIEVVNLANNHTRDYGEEGYKQTRQHLDQAGISYFGDDMICYMEQKGIRIAMIGSNGWNASNATKEKIGKQIQEAKTKADLVVVMFHWGIERDFYANKIQKDLAYYCIDQGVDLVVGSHPHVVQGIETYKGKNIIYSLGNFSFGANRNPSDKDTFIYQETFKLTDQGIESIDSKVIPCSISSEKSRNNYQPIPLVDQEAERVINRLKTYSKGFPQSYFK